MAVRFLDNVIDAGHYPLPQIEAMVRGNRKIGLGVMGFADVLIMMDIRYGTRDCLELIDKVMARIEAKAKEASKAIAESRGAFPNLGGKQVERGAKERHFAQHRPHRHHQHHRGVLQRDRAPLRLPYGAPCARRARSCARPTPNSSMALAQHRLDVGQVLSAMVGHTSVQDLDILPDDMKRIFVSAHDVHPLDQVRVQAAFQEHVDNAVSKTINLRADASITDVEEAFTLAHRSKVQRRHGL